MTALPALEPGSEFFWTSGRDGVLRFLCCQDCHYFIHPPAPTCPRCLGTSVLPEAVSGRGRLASYTVIVGGGADGADSIAGWIEFPEQEDLRLTSSIVDVGPDEVRLDMEVVVAFESHEDVFIPKFRPAI